MRKSETLRRDTAFMKTCMQTAIELGSGKYTPSVKHIVKLSLRKPAPSYFVSFDLAKRNLEKIIASGASSRSSPSLRMKMWYEMLHKLTLRNGISSDGKIKPHVLSDIVFRGKPSAFFISYSYALRLYHQISAQTKILNHEYHNLN